MRIRLTPKTAKGVLALASLYKDKDHRKVKLLAIITKEETTIIILFKKVVTKVMNLKDPAALKTLINSGVQEMMHGYGAEPEDYEVVICQS